MRDMARLSSQEPLERVAQPPSVRGFRASRGQPLFQRRGERVRLEGAEEEPTDRRLLGVRRPQEHLARVARSPVADQEIESSARSVASRLSSVAAAVTTAKETQRIARRFENVLVIVDDEDPDPRSRSSHLPPLKLATRG